MLLDQGRDAFVREDALLRPLQALLHVFLGAGAARDLDRHVHVLDQEGRIGLVLGGQQEHEAGHGQ